MNNYLTSRMQQRIQIFYRYANALERGDIDLVAEVLHEAERDQVLERMILEINEVYQDEDQVAVDAHAVEYVQNFVTSQGMTGQEIVKGSSFRKNAFPLSWGQKGTPERMQQNVKTQENLSQPIQEDEYMPAHSSNRSRRFWILVQSLAAVLVVGALLGSFLVLFASHHTGTGHSSNASGSWRIVKSPNPEPGGDTLSGVAAISANDAWAVGSTLTGSQRTILEHWNGTSWSAVESPNPGSGGKVLNAVAAVSANDVWAVGSFSTGGSGSTDRTLIERWNGANWRVVASPNPGVDENILHAVAAISAQDVWAVGEAFTFNGRNEKVWRTLIEHWDGRNWSVVESPSLGEGDALQAVTAASANDIWAVGNFSYSGYGRGPVTLIEHWNGRDWSVVPSPSPGTPGNSLWGVAAVSANDAWAVGSYFSTDGIPSRQALIEHWNGVRWSVVKSPHSGAGLEGVTLGGVAAISTNDVWAVGYGYAEQRATGGRSNASLGGLIEHWNGTSWSVVTSPSSGTLNGVSTVSANDIWAVGVKAAIGAQTLTELYHS
jgi:hypothetical protein